MTKTFKMTLDKNHVTVNFSINSTGHAYINWVKDSKDKEIKIVKRQACLVFDKVYDIVNNIE